MCGQRKWREGQRWGGVASLPSAFLPHHMCHLSLTLRMDSHTLRLASRPCLHTSRERVGVFMLSRKLSRETSSFTGWIFAPNVTILKNPLTVLVANVSE